MNKKELKEKYRAMHMLHSKKARECLKAFLALDKKEVN